MSVFTFCRYFVSIGAILVFVLSYLIFWAIHTLLEGDISFELSTALFLHSSLVFSFLLEKKDLKVTFIFIPVWLISLLSIYWAAYYELGFISLFYSALLTWCIYLLAQRDIIKMEIIRDMQMNSFPQKQHLLCKIKDEAGTLGVKLERQMLAQAYTPKVGKSFEKVHHNLSIITLYMDSHSSMIPECYRAELQNCVQIMHDTLSTHVFPANIKKINRFIYNVVAYGGS